jgi:hypothetical protein
MAIKVSKVKQRSTTLSDPAPAEEAEGLPSLAWPVEHWLQFQADLFRAATPMLLGWIDRRCEASGAALRAAGGLASCQDVGEAMAIHSDWLSGSMKRLDHDLQAAGQHALAVVHCTTGATQRAAQTSRDEARLGANLIIRNLDAAQPLVAANREPAAPVVEPIATEALWQSR